MIWKPRERVELYQEQLLRIALKDGRIQAVYAGRPLTRVDVEILDLDDAQVSDDAELRFLRRSVAEVEDQCTKFY